MFTIKNDIINLTKGDNAEIDIRVFNKDGQEIQILPTDVITLSVRKTPSTQAVITKTATLNSIFLVPSDTTSLTAGSYVYDIDFVRDNEKQTIIPENIFNIMEAI